MIMGFMDKLKETAGKAAEKAEIEKILSKKPSQLTSKERDILNAYKYGYIPGTNIPAQSDISGVLY